MLELTGQLTHKERQLNLMEHSLNPHFPSTVGIIAEYNPFHNGHAYQIKKARELTGAKFCVVVMSGDFVQRGCPAIFDKYARTKMALASGADLVLELPPAFAVSSAEDFAACGAAILDRLQVVSHLCFGSECGDIEPLKKIADILWNETEEFQNVLKESLKLGITFPEARTRALEKLSDSELSSLLSSPNNILGVEYLKALLRRNSALLPVTLKRLGSDYHDSALSSSENASCFSSAQAIRNALKESKDPVYQSLKSQVPDSVWEIIRSTTPLFLEDFSSLLSYRILELEHQNTNFQIFCGFSEELARRLKRQNLRFSSFEERIQDLKTRQYTYTRVSRSLIHLLLHITKEDILFRKKHDYISYFRILGFRKEAAPLLTQIKKAADLPLITKTADAADILSPKALKEFEQDLFCSHVYQSVLAQKYGACEKNEYTRSLVIL